MTFSGIGKTRIIHPLLFAAFPILFLFSHNIGQLYFNDVFTYLLITTGVAAFAWIILGLFIKNMERSGIIVSLFLLLFFSYGQFRTFLDATWKIFVFSILWVELFSIGCYLVIKKIKKSSREITVILNVVSSALVVFCMVTIITYHFTGTGKNIVEPGHIKDDSGEKAQQKNRPDIYFIILDAYGREDILHEICGFDNSAFTGYLRKKKFYIADRAVSNYCQTGLSLGSCLDMDYLDEFVKQIGEYSTSNQPLKNIIEKSRTISYLKKKGYKIISFASGRPETELKWADQYLKKGKPIDPFLNILENITPIPDIKKIFIPNNKYDVHRETILYALNNLGKVASHGREPRFVFAHIEAPHPPFVFGQAGAPLNLEARFNDHDGDWLIRRGRFTREEYIKRYIDQLIFINSRIKITIDEILANSSQPPIVFLAGDHGPRVEMNWDDPEKTNAKEAMSILLACFLPNGGEARLYPGISLVNCFRVILSHYFNLDLALLPDKCYLSTSKHLYKFHDITNRVGIPD